MFEPPIVYVDLDDLNIFKCNNIVEWQNVMKDYLKITKTEVERYVFDQKNISDCLILIADNEKKSGYNQNVIRFDFSDFINVENNIKDIVLKKMDSNITKQFKNLLHIDEKELMILISQEITARLNLYENNNIKLLTNEYNIQFIEKIYYRQDLSISMKIIAYKK